MRVDFELVLHQLHALDVARHFRGLGALVAVLHRAAQRDHGVLGLDADVGHLERGLVVDRLLHPRRDHGVVEVAVLPGRARAAGETQHCGARRDCENAFEGFHRGLPPFTEVCSTAALGGRREGRMPCATPPPSGRSCEVSQREAKGATCFRCTPRREIGRRIGWMRSVRLRATFLGVAAALVGVAVAHDASAGKSGGGRSGGGAPFSGGAARFAGSEMGGMSSSSGVAGGRFVAVPAGSKHFHNGHFHNGHFHSSFVAVGVGFPFYGYPGYYYPGYAYPGYYSPPPPPPGWYFCPAYNAYYPANVPCPSYGPPQYYQAPGSPPGYYEAPPPQMYGAPPDYVPPPE